MRRCAWMIAVGCMGLNVAAQAQEWRQITYACESYAEQRHPMCADCAPWQWLAACTAQNYYRQVPQQLLTGCIGRVAAARGPHALPAAGDPVRDVMNCLAGH